MQKHTATFEYKYSEPVSSIDVIRAMRQLYHSMMQILRDKSNVRDLRVKNPSNNKWVLLFNLDGKRIEVTMAHHPQDKKLTVHIPDDVSLTVRSLLQKTFHKAPEDLVMGWIKQSIDAVMPTRSVLPASAAKEVLAEA